jgi:hypothetical protein
MESMMLMVWRSRQDIRLYETKTVANAIMIAGQAPSAELNRELQKTWTDYREALFPFSKGIEKTQDSKALDYLRSQIKQGPLKIIPLEPLTQGGKRRMRNRRQA